MYLYSLPDWPKFQWDEQFLAPRLTELKIKQARLLGRMEGLGPSYQAQTNVSSLALELIKSCEIEGQLLDQNAVYKSFSKILGIEDVKPVEQKFVYKTVDVGAHEGSAVNQEGNIEGLVQILFDATTNFEEPLFHVRLYGWHTAMFNESQPDQQVIGRYRNNPKDQPLRVVSGPTGRETVHFIAPDSDLLHDEMNAFLNWFNDEQLIDPVLKAGVAHIWFLNIFPFSAGNGVIARMITEMLLCRADLSPQRYFSLSAQMRKERNQYFAVLEKSGKDSMDISNWLAWFIDCLHRAVNNADEQITQKLAGLRIRDKVNNLSLNERQRLMLNRMAEGNDAPITSSIWARYTESSQDSAGRDINDLLIRKILVKEVGGGRSTSYSLSKKIFG
jgi:Fic family protein